MRPFCIATIGGILGIIMGLYFKSIALFTTIFIILALFIMHFLLKSSKERKRKIAILIIFIISFILFESYTILQENSFEKVNREYQKQEIEIQAVVVSDKMEKAYKDVYYIKVLNAKGSIQENEQEEKQENSQNSEQEIKNNTENINKQDFKIILNVKRQKDKKISLEFGDMIYFKGIYEQPSEARNEGGFNYSKYLKTKKITGVTTVKAEEIKVIDKNRTSGIARVIHNVRKSIVEKVRKILPEDTANLCTSLLLGDKTELSEDIQENFRKSNLSHMLAISGAHVSYILLGITTVVQELKLHKRWGKIILIAFFIFFMALTGFTPSVTRSCIMVILQLLASILFRKSDTYQNLAISAFVILLANPYTILDIGFQLSFGGTIGIVVFLKKLLIEKDGNVEKEEQMQDKLKIKLIIKKGLQKIKAMCLVTVSANLVILPIMMYHFNTISLTFLISNLLASPILGVSLIVGMVFIISLFIVPLAKVISLFLQPILQLLISIAEISSKLPFSQILVPPPKIWQIILYYLLLVFIFFRKRNSQNKFNISQKVFAIVMILLIISPYILKIFPNNKLAIFFIDVGQGDSMLIQTPSNKTILIDGGGSETGSFDVGEKTLIPYLLDKGVMSIDYMIFSHFDSDHCQGLFSVMEKLKVRNAVISKQGEDSNNYTKFIKIAKTKRIKVIVVQAGDKVAIDKQCYLSILFPKQELINTNVLNNNSLVAKFVYQSKEAKEFSLLLTGDIEAIAEAQLVQMYQGTNELQSDVLKVAHHRF